MSRLEILAKIDDLHFGNCKGCKWFDSKNKNSVEKCKACDINKQLQELGNQLIKKERKPLGETKPVLDIYAYQDYKAQGKTDADIARDYGIKQPTLSYYKKKWTNGNEKAVLKVVEQPKEETPTKTTRREKESELGELVNELSNELNNEKKKVAELEAKVKELEHINAACTDVEEETDSLRSQVNYLTGKNAEVEEKYFDTFERLKQSDYALQNIRKTIERYESENKALRELVALWI
jgi:transposase-like protein